MNKKLTRTVAAKKLSRIMRRNIRPADIEAIFYGQKKLAGYALKRFRAVPLFVRSFCSGRLNHWVPMVRKYTARVAVTNEVEVYLGHSAFILKRENRGVRDAEFMRFLFVQNLDRIIDPSMRLKSQEEESWRRSK